MGISGDAFSKGKIVFSNRGKNEPTFNPDIDNVSTYKGVENFIFLPIFGSKDQKMGLVQFLNKTEGREVHKTDMVKKSLVINYRKLCFLYKV